MNAAQAAMHLVAYLEAFGLNPSAIAMEGWDEEGYDEWVFGPDGNVLMLRSGRQTERKPWPPGVSVEIVSALVDAMHGKGPFSG